MLQITPDQMLTLGEATRQRFIASVVKDLDLFFPESVKTEESRVAFIARGIDCAKGFGLHGKTDVTRFLEYILKYGLDFGIAPATSWAGTILRTPRLSGAQMMDRIDDSELFVQDGSAEVDNVRTPL